MLIQQRVPDSRPVLKALVTLLGFLGVLSAEPAAAQRWELRLSRVSIDHDRSPSIADTGEQIPPGLGVSLTHVFRRPVFVEVEFTRGSEVRTGSLCGGFFAIPEECVVEQVGYSGGLVALSAGWAGELNPSSRLRIGVRPKVGIGYLRASEAGRETGGTFFEMTPSATVGVAGDLGLIVFPSRGIELIGFGGFARVKPFRISDCQDCQRVFDGSVPQSMAGVGLAWRL